VTSAGDPDRIRSDIERTQAELRTDVDALAEKVTPGRVVERRVGRVRSTAARWRDNIMGSDPGAQLRSGTHRASGGVRGAAHSAAGSASGAASSAADTAADTASRAADTLQEAPTVARRQAQGNPLAAGVIAFGAGWLVSSLLPATRREQELASQAQDIATEKGRPVAQTAGDKAKEVAENLREPAQQAAESVGARATDAGTTVAEEGRSAADQVQGRAQDAAGNVRNTAG
jgi:hypothetical protein